MSTPRVFPPFGQGIASKYEILPNNLKNWKKQFIENMSLAFDKSAVVKEYKEEISQLQKESDALAKKVGILTIERDWLEGKLVSLVPQGHFLRALIK